MQQSFKKGFEKDSMLMGSAIAGSILWIINAVFNYIATDYRAFLINIMYVICLITLCAAEFKKEKNVIQGMIGALLMVSVIGNVNVLTEMIQADIPSRDMWQVITSLVLIFFLFINHFLLSHSEYHITRRVYLNQLIVMVLLLLRCYQIIANLVGGELSTLVIEIEVGLLAIIPTLNVVVCIECRNDGYRI
ncbi:MAG: hypothetical protein K6F28_04955 [Lachnospiraceae bacterium]|nr:hypothetical protein [Lachnospiraceae bacterium]